MGIISLVLSAIKAVIAGFGVFKQERDLYNRPDMVKNKLDLAKQAAQDAVNKADAVLANPNSTPAQHAEALRQLRILSS